MTSEERSARARKAAQARWAATTDTSAATAPARAAMADKFQREADPSAARSAHYRQLAAASADVRGARAADRRAARTAPGAALEQLLVITQLTREVAGWYNREPVRVPFYPIEMTNHFPTPLTWRSFKIGSSDYDTSADEAYCPCGEVVGIDMDGADAVAGDFADAAEQHIATAHPEARR